MEIKEYTRDCIPDVVQFERDLRTEEDFWGWEIDEAYIADVTASFMNPAFDNSLSLLAYQDGKVVGRIDSTKICSRFDGSTKAYTLTKDNLQAIRDIMAAYTTLLDSDASTAQSVLSSLAK